jgi:4-hydroxybutyrate dehydrogenase
LTAWTRAWANIEAATRNGQDREARRQMMSASMQGAMAFQKGLGCVHSLSHSLGGVNPKLHHGTLNAMFLPAVVRFNAAAPSVKAELRMARMAYAMGMGTPSNPSEDVAMAVTEMNARLGLPSGLRAMGVEFDWLDRVVAGALADHCHKTNPREAGDRDYREILVRSM